MSRLLTDLLAGNAAHAEAFDGRFDELQHSQRPAAVTVCCADSRVLGDHIWGNDEPGRLFTVSNIGNRVVQRTAAGRVVSGDVLYSLEHTGTETVVVVGHTGCGAVTATYDALTGGIDEPPGIEHCIELLKPNLEPGLAALPDGLERAATVNHLVEYNVDEQVGALLESDAVPDAVTVVGVVYDFGDVYSGRRGEVQVVNVDGETDVAAIREAYPWLANRVERLWER